MPPLDSMSLCSVFICLSEISGFNCECLMLDFKKSLKNKVESVYRVHFNIRNKLLDDRNQAQSQHLLRNPPS
jgi:hypothetical protein